MTLAPSASGLHAGLDRIEPQRLVAHRASTLYLEGWCFHAALPITRLEVLLGVRPARVLVYPFERPARDDHEIRRRASGFCAVVDVAAFLGAGRRTLALRATLADGRVSVAAVGEIELRKPVASPAPAPAPEESRTRNEPLVAICMATHNPPEMLFTRQIDSIRRQSHGRFLCLICDDASDPEHRVRLERVAAGDRRFIYSPAPHRLGFYSNFERCLELVPEEASFVALCDQDDEWHPDKLSILRQALDETGALLAYSDMTIVDEDGALLAPSFWSERRNNSSSLGSLLLANTVTGAASLFRRDLLADVLPFPPNVGRPYHDHWVACVALALGRIAYVERPLHDYTQHESNVVGHVVPAADSKSGLVSALRRFVRDPPRRARNTLAQARDVFFVDLLRIELFGRTIALRLNGRIQPQHAADVRRAAEITGSLRSLLWLVGRSARDVRGDSETGGVEAQLIKGIAWRHAQALRPAGEGLRRRLARLR